MIPKCVKENNSCEIHKNGKYVHWACGEYDPLKRKEIYQNNAKTCKCGNKHSQFSNQCRKCSAKRLWQGENASYNAKHRWLQRNRQKPKECQFCGEIKRLHWANISGNYLRDDINDWVAICSRCHSKYDNNYPPIQTKEYRQTYKKQYENKSKKESQ